VRIGSLKPSPTAVSPGRRTCEALRVTAR
jgi:hypothetical protein